jgi:hypothetical protein
MSLSQGGAQQSPLGASNLAPNSFESSSNRSVLNRCT